jgi:DNA repair protein RadC
MSFFVEKGAIPQWFEIRRRPIEGYTQPLVNSSVDVYELLGHELSRAEQEVLVVLGLNHRNRVVGAVEVARGTPTKVCVGLPDILRAALILGACGVILVHNHPGGDPGPSSEDIELTKRVGEACKTIGIHLVDHVIIAGLPTAYPCASFLDLRLLRPVTAPNPNASAFVNEPGPPSTDAAAEVPMRKARKAPRRRRSQTTE